MRILFGRILLPLVFLSAASASLPRIIATTENAIRLVPLDYESRRELIMGKFYASIRRIRASWPGETPISIVLAQPHDIDRAIFVNSYLYPHASHIYWGDQVKQACHRPARTLWVDVNQPNVVQEAPFTIAVAATDHPMTRAAEFFVPFAVAMKGEDAEDYFAVQGVLAAERNVDVTLTLRPAARTRIYHLEGGTPLMFSNFVFQAFHTSGVGWLEVSAPTAVQAKFAFVSTARRQAVPLPVLSGVPRVSLHVGGCTKVWLVNTQPALRRTTINDRVVVLRAFELREIDAPAVAEVTPDAGVFAFGSQNDKTRGTTFIWPRQIE